MATKNTPPADGNWVREAIRRMGGQTRVVMATGASASTVDRWARIKMISDPVALIKIANQTGIEAHLLAGVDRKGNPLGGSSSGEVAPASEPPETTLPAAS